MEGFSIRQHSVPVKRYCRNNILKAIGLKPHKHLPHTSRLKLEYTGGISVCDGLKGLFIVKWYFFDVEIRLGFLYLNLSVVYYSKIAQRKEVEL